MDDKRSVAVMQQTYLKIIRPAFASLRSQLSPDTEPVKVVLIDAFLERWEMFYRGGEAGADEQYAKELEELEPWLFKIQTTISARAAHGGPMGDIIRDAGNPRLETYDILERERRGAKGRPRKALLAIDALEMELAGCSHDEIASRLVPLTTASTDFEPEDDGVVRRLGMKAAQEDQQEQRRDSIRKLIDTVKPIYEKYKPRK